MSTLFNLYDYIFFAFILFFACIGLARGFWVQLLSIFVWLGGIAFYYFENELIEHVILSKYMTPAVAHWFLLALVMLSCFFVNFLTRFILGSLFKINAFTFFNKVGGFILGVCGSSMVIFLIIYSINHSSLSNESVDWKKSYVVVKIAPLMESFKEHNDNKNAFSTPNTSIPKVGDTYEVA
ncbi:MAG: CvpA family protein [Gammaproteobacteria bacterium]|nr:CvpA family protein [Gammaproteobacteria bacterium]